MQISPAGSVEVAQHDDVSALLAAGRTAVAHTQTYVSACQKVGYRNPELTGYGGQLLDRYDSETGLDLRLLDSDCGALRGLADAADAAVRVQREQLTVLVGAWRGPGADAAADFLRRHCAAAAELASGIRAAASGCAELRDELWRLIDTKVTVALAVDDRVGAARPSWLAAAEAVGAGVAGDPVEIIEKQVIPYVDNDVRGEWVSAMRTARDGAVAAFDAAVAAAGRGSEVMFAMPAAPLIPRFDGPSLVVSEMVRPSTVDPVPGPAPLPAPDSARPVVISDSPVASREDLPGGLAGPEGLVPPGDMGLPFGGLPGGGGGLGGLSGLGGLVPRLAEAFGGSGAGGLSAEPLDGTDSPRGQSDADEEPADLGEDPDETADEPTESEESERTEEVTQGEPVAGSDAGLAQEALVADSTEGLRDQAPVSADPPRTPCEIAAEELPQVGP